MAEKEYIERESLIDMIKNDCKELVRYSKEEAIDCVIAAPAADVASVKHGHWETPTKKFPCYDWKCSECGCEEYRQTDRNGQYREMNFCPNCGAKMDRSEND